MAAEGVGLRLAVVGGGWAGLAAAVSATEAGRRVTLFEMAAATGGRARGVMLDGLALDNGQHILIGAYSGTLALMQTVGADTGRCLARLPLTLRYPDGRGLTAPPGPAWLAFARAVMSCQGWTRGEKARLLLTACGWAGAGFACPADWTVERLCRRLPAPVRALLIDPLCIAALNTPPTEASAAVLLRVLHDTLFCGRGGADLLLPRRSLAELLPVPAMRWLRDAGADLRLGRRVGSLQRGAAGWRVDGEDFDAVILACPAAEAARLTKAVAAAWSARAQAIRYEPIITVYLRCLGARLPSPMTALVEGPQAPAQFAFDHGRLGATPGLFAFVISGARRWTDAGLERTSQAVLQQAQTAFAPGTWPTPPTLVRALADKRATFRCTPGLDRPPSIVASALLAAGDYVEGPYPATLEGAVRSGQRAARLLPA